MKTRRLFELLLVVAIFALTTLLDASDEWHQAYEDDVARVFVRTGSRPIAGVKANG